MLIIPLLLLIFMIGFSVTAILKIKVVFVERLALSYFLGIGVSTFLVFIIDFVFNFDFSLINTFAILGASFVASFALGFKEIITVLREINFGKARMSFNKKTIFWIFILSIFSYTLLVNSFWPITDWDALALYDFRAKVFMIDSNLVHAALNNGYFIQYPLLTSLAHLFVYQVGLPNPKFIYSLFYLSLVTVFYFSLRRNISENKAMLFTVILSLAPDIFKHATMSYTNLPFTAYLCLGVLYLYEWMRNKNIWSLILSSILVGISSWVRIIEPFWIVPLFIVCIVALRKRKLKEIIYYLPPILLFYESWRYFMKYIIKLLPPPETTSQLKYKLLDMFTVSRLVDVLNYLYINVFSTWGLIVLVFILIIFWIYTSKQKEKHGGFLLIILAFFAFLIVGTFYFSIVEPTWRDIPDSARRMSMFFIPLIIYYLGLSL